MSAGQTVVETVQLPLLSSGNHGIHVALDWHSANQQSLIAESNEYDNFGYLNFVIP